ncbi:MAG: UDP-2,3-diacylglucosamine diphosphatase [Bacteroidetes bacterium]|jgi:UDP-2,3-diacylglucosamine pyrophosphatase LpxH|nr:UDP-2,3-diacylglucosamine diphosphatase [Bacteroidota bacterium]MDF1863259.1 UDP-2,3-diacylglucosamine diphosphatase [Saprospiraceae bacterium]
MKREIDISIISDVHLGTYGCHSIELLNYLKNIKVRTLILNGDFIDMWQFKKKYFPSEHIQVIRQILKMSNEGTKIYYITGNHDDVLRRYSDFSAGQIHLRDKLVLQIKGKKYWIFHGDIFDLSIQYSRFIAKLGGKSYDLLILINRFINHFRVRFGKPQMSFAAKIKEKVKKAVKFIHDFENTAIKHAFVQDYDYVICGHIHKPQIRTIKHKHKSITYMNSGDWVENLTALEYQWGKWTIYTYDELDFEMTSPRLRVKDLLKEDFEKDLLKEILKDSKETDWERSDA